MFFLYFLIMKTNNANQLLLVYFLSLIYLYVNGSAISCYKVLNNENDNLWYPRENITFLKVPRLASMCFERLGCITKYMRIRVGGRKEESLS